VTSDETDGLYLEKRTGIQNGIFTVLYYFNLNFERILWFGLEEPNSCVCPTSSVNRFRRKLIILETIDELSLTFTESFLEVKTFIP
jgi:hypothetical protein